MPKTLIITEKPDASKQIAKALSDDSVKKKLYKKVPYYEITRKGKAILIGCAVGHLYNLVEKNKSTKEYSFDLIWQPSYIKSKTAKFTKKYLDTLKKLAKEADDYIGATDLDTEGELILKNVLRFVYKKQDAKRMKFSTLTKQDLIDAYENMSPHIDHKLVESGETRHFLDNFWGLASSKSLTSSVKKAGQFKILSSGRVQSPILNLLTHRELEIGSFKPTPYWQLLAFINVKNQILEALHEKDKFWKQDESKKILKKCKDKKTIVRKIIKKEYKTQPPTPFNITSLQTEAYRLFKFSPKQTLDIAQSLYLNAHISYPRSSSEKLPEKIGYRNILKSLTKFNEFKKNAEQLLSKKTLKPREGKRTDPAHVALFPTDSPPKFLSELNEQQRKIYTLIVKRFLAVFGDPALRQSLEISFDINGELFKIKGARTLNPGWISLYEHYTKFKETKLPELEENQTYNAEKLEIKKDETKPPRRYTQGSIIAEMESRNLGTRATRSNILQILYDRHYIEDKSIKVTQLGKAVASVLEKNVPELVSEELTRHFEKEMEQIKQGKKKKADVLKEAKTTVTKILKEFKEKEEKIGKELLNAVRETQQKATIVGNCLRCSNNLKIMYSRKNRQYFVSCEDYKNCKTTFSLPNYSLPKPTEEKCDECSFPIVLIIRKGKRPWKFCINASCPKKEEWIKSQFNTK